MSQRRGSTCCFLIVAALCRIVTGDSPQADLVLVQGAAGEAAYADQFADWANSWRELAQAQSMALHAIGFDSTDQPDRDRLQETLGEIARNSTRPLWLVLIGHGTWFQDEAKFNLVGPDVAARELAQWLPPPGCPVAIIDCTSCSGPFIDRLSGDNRVVITATRSGDERNFARFGGYLAGTLHDLRADVDHDESISLLEAFLVASRQTQNFYQDQGRLATEHALLDDNGDRQGTPADLFRGIRSALSPSQTQVVDGVNAHRWMLVRGRQRLELTSEQQRDQQELEAAIESLRHQKSSMDEDDYYRQLEDYLVRLARLGQGP